MFVVNAMTFSIAEDVIRRRLLIDGDGTGDDRRLNVLLKSFIKWCNATNEPPGERYERKFCRIESFILHVIAEKQPCCLDAFNLNYMRFSL
jgi:THO complex subunit 7